MRFNPQLAHPFRRLAIYYVSAGGRSAPGGGIGVNGKITTLDRVPLGCAARVTTLMPDAALRRLLDLGLVKGASVEPLLLSPSGGTRAYFLRGAVIALRPDVASKITVEL